MTMRLSRHLGLGTTSDGNQRIIEQARLPQPMQERAFNVASQAASGLPSGTSVGGTAPPGLMGDVLDGFLPLSPIVKRRAYREMYYNDPIIGSGIDLLSSFPFSDFSLTGINDEVRLKKFAASIDMVDVKTLLPTLSTDYLVLGQFIGNLHWNNKDKIYDALMPHNIDFCQIQNVPVYGVDPVVKLELPQDLVKMLNGQAAGGVKDRQVLEQLRENVKRIPEEMLNAMTQKGGVTLNQDDLVYISRPGMVSDYEGVSLLQRCLPIWLMEKALIRGTLDQVWKRQRGILWASVGGEDWEPTAADYQAINDLILSADHDPTGAVITTRQGVVIQEIRRGDDFWRYDMFYDFTKNAKLQAMGISENFVTGDSTIAAMEGALNVTMQHFKAYRNMLTKQIFYDKIFPTVAVANGYRRRNRNIVLGETATHEDFLRYNEERAWHDGIKYNPVTRELIAEFASSGVNIYNTDLTNYTMPKIVWQESLDENTDSKMADVLKLAEEHGIPVPMRSWLALAKLGVDDLIDQKDNDINLRKFFKEWRDEAKKYAPADPNAEGGEDGGGGGFSFASVEGRFGNSEFADGQQNLPGEGSVSKVGLLNRDFGEHSETRRITHRGTTGSLSAKGQALVNDKMRKVIIEAHGRVRDTERAAAAALPKPEPFRKHYPLRRPR